MTFRGFGTVPAGSFGLRGFERGSSACYFTQYEMSNFTRYFSSVRELILRSTHKTLISSSRNCKTSRPATVSPYRKRNSFFFINRTEATQPHYSRQFCSDRFETMREFISALSGCRSSRHHVRDDPRYRPKIPSKFVVLLVWLATAMHMLLFMHG